MPEMVMQMPGRHWSLSAPFLMDQIIQTAFRTIASLWRTYIQKPKEHFCSIVVTLELYFLKYATMREAIFNNGIAWSSSQHEKHNSSLFLPRHPDPAEALYTTTSKTSGIHCKTDSWGRDADPDEARIALLAGRRERSLSYDSQGITARWNREHLSK